MIQKNTKNVYQMTSQIIHIEYQAIGYGETIHCLYAI